MGGALSDGVCSTVQSRGPAENLLFSITPWLTAGKDRHLYPAKVRMRTERVPAADSAGKVCQHPARVKCRGKGDVETDSACTPPRQPVHAGV